MGGKIWSEAEERYFWRVAVSQSPKRVGIDLAKREKSWDRLAAEMQHAMGDSARRRYTGVMLFEHFFQNTEIQRRSPNAHIALIPPPTTTLSTITLSTITLWIITLSTITPVDNHDDLSPSSSFVYRRSQYVRFVTEPDATRCSQIWYPHLAPSGSSSSAISRFSPPATSSPTLYRPHGISDSTEATINTSNLMCLSEYGESELEEGEIRE
ncbi:hypothetical protein CIB48_g1575 [Xylaria polymorpha]|nr:hypothetical protein CIB48_g1575 [Xylaria polymorpha]